ncbi:MAG TPA: hypothetical protein ENH87_16125 [Pricia antarctica]|uniref:Uncharacterized protein n=2 Tax=root TaxID=1 RepID=A0A831VS78_9FLAO|nr:hypothetical protein [Pricia antarctica]
MNCSFYIVILLISVFSSGPVFRTPAGFVFQDGSTKIRVINATDHSFTNVSLFSMNFDNLLPNDTLAYKELRYDSLRDDPLIYCVIDGKNLARYLTIPDKAARRFTYVIDSVTNGILHVSSYSEISE